MSATARRLLAIPIGMLGFGLRLLVSLWLWPLARNWDERVGLLAVLAGVTLSILMPLGVFALIGGYRRRPAAFTTGKGSFVAPPAVSVYGFQTILAFTLSGQRIMPEPVAGTHSAPAQTDVLTPVTVALVGVFWAIGLCYATLRRPSIHLDQCGLTVRRLSGRTFISWDDVDPPGPPPPDKLAPRTLTVYQLNRSWVARVPLSRLEVAAGFLTEAIRHYAQHPDARAAIGTSAELARLQADVERQADVVRRSSLDHGATNSPARS